MPHAVVETSCRLPVFFEYPSCARTRREAHACHAVISNHTHLPAPLHREGPGPLACLAKWDRALPPPVLGPVAQGFRPANPKLVLLPRRNSNGAGTLAPSTTHRPPRGSSWHTMLIHGAPALHAGALVARADCSAPQVTAVTCFFLACVRDLTRLGVFGIGAHAMTHKKNARFFSCV